MNKYLWIVISFVLTLASNALANILPYNGQLTAEISAKYGNYFVPENYVFSIWGLIYASLSVFVVVLGMTLKNNKQYIDKIAPVFISINVINAVWMLAWHYEYLLVSVVLMLALLVLLIKMYSITKTFGSKVFAANFSNSLYLGWISVATIANISAYLVSLPIARNDSFEMLTTIGMVVIALTLGILAVRLEKSYTYFLVIVWATTGIAVNFLALVTFSTAVFSVTILAVMVVLSGLIVKKAPLQSKKLSS